MEKAKNGSTQSVFPIPLKSFFGFNRYKKSLTTQLDEEKVQENKENIDSEFESIQYILNEQELTVYPDITADLIETTDATERSKLSKLIKLSLIPTSEAKFLVIDEAKDIKIEFRCLPALDLIILLSQGYPSSSPPLFYLADTTSCELFYEPMRNFLYERLNEKWQEDSMVIYECNNMVQTELIDAFLQSD